MYYININKQKYYMLHTNYLALTSTSLGLTIPPMVCEKPETFVTKLIDNLNNEVWQTRVKEVEPKILALKIKQDCQSEDFFEEVFNFVDEVQSELFHLLKDEWFIQGHTVYQGSNETDDTDEMSTAYDELWAIAEYFDTLSIELSKIWQTI